MNVPGDSMLPYFSRIIINKNICTVVCISLAILLFNYKSHAQSLGDPIVHITFGSGSNQFAGPLAADSGSTNYTYSNGKSPEDGFYAIVNTTAGLNRGWVVTTDHTGDVGGYMMVVNASYEPGLFYTRKVAGLCGSTTYQFSAFIKNILRGNGILPDVTFSIETIDGTVLGMGHTNPINADDTWREYPFTFTTPANTQTVVVKMTNNAPGGGGNDIAIDDITFRPYGTQVTLAFDQANTTFCTGVPQTITIKTTTALDPNYYQKLQVYVNGSWKDQTTGGTTTSFSFPSPTTAGTYSYRTVSGYKDNIDIKTCVVSSNLLKITVLPLPVAVFSVADTICQGTPAVFKDQSTAGGSTVASWLWDFDDGQISTQQNPSHLYTIPGNHTVKLTVTNGSGCISFTTTKSIHIIPQVNISFSTSTPGCATQPITFTDVSASAEGNITSRVWDYGDSTKETKANNAPFQHIYAVAGNYAVKLVITSDKGCVTTLTKTIKVNPLPIVDFDLPKVCYADLSAKFTDKTTIADTSTGLTYLWNFGDNDANAGNPNTSALQNPSHYYGKTKQYQVSLTVTSASGCTSATVTKMLQVNGSPVPDFEVLNKETLCANREVFFKNKSRSTVGQITKIVWYFDTNDLSIQETDNNPYPDKLYRHTYPALHFPQTDKSYNVRMVAFTGDANVCQEEKIVQIKLLATPILSFNPPEAVCLNNGPVHLDVSTSEGTGIPGLPVFSGPGVSGSTFDPTIAGVGTFVIKCIYTTTATTACADTVTRSITVKPIPTVNAGPGATILAGGTTALHATATGDSLKYSWLPVTGLSNSTIPDPIVTINETVTYTLTVTNGEGCAVTGKATITALQVPVIPNAFTPNGDGINDLWSIKYLDTYPDCTVDVFNRYGQKIYSSVGYTKAWDGRFNNADLPIGVYYYIINPKYGRKAVSGYVTIIR